MCILLADLFLKSIHIYFFPSSRLLEHLSVSPEYITTHMHITFARHGCYLTHHYIIDYTQPLVSSQWELNPYISMVVALSALWHILLHEFSLCMWANKMHKILVIRFYFLLDALHVSDYISPSSGATFISCTSHLVYAGTIHLAVVWL